MRALLLAFTAVVSLAVHADELTQLRADYATHFLDPETHLRLSKHLEEKGDRLTAFFISEAARQQYFDEETFNRAFAVVFRDDHFDNSPEGEKRVAAEVVAAPDDAKKHSALADVFISRNEWKEAEAELRIAMKLAPDSDQYVNALAEVLRRDARSHDAAALLVDWVASHADSRGAARMRVETLLTARSPEAAKAIDEALTTHPDDAILHYHRAGLLNANGDHAGAAKAYVRAAELDPKSPVIQGWTARFFLKQAKDPERALDYYLNAYFLDPHFNDGEYAEGRIRTLAMERGAARYQAERSKGAALVKLLRDRDPFIALLAAQAAQDAWSEELTGPLIEFLGQDDPNLRAGAMLLLGSHMRANDERLAALLAHDDLRVRGAGAYVAGALRGEAIVPLMTSWLDHESQLIRYDAMSVLAMNGGASGRAVLMKLRKAGKVTEPRLRAILDMVTDEQR
jgi:Flp pilus assembly protein TadD